MVGHEKRAGSCSALSALREPTVWVGDRGMATPVPAASEGPPRGRWPRRPTHRPVVDHISMIARVADPGRLRRPVQEESVQH